MTPALQFHNQSGVFPPNLPLSEAVQVGSLLFLSGQLGLVPGTLQLVRGGMAAEARQALENMRRILESSGSSMKHVVRCSVMLANIGEWGAFNEVYKSFFPDPPQPARSAFGVQLALNARVEIECIAVVKGK